MNNKRHISTHQMTHTLVQWQLIDDWAMKAIMSGKHTPFCIVDTAIRQAQSHAKKMRP